MTLVKFKNDFGLGNLPAFERSMGFSPFFSESLNRLWNDEDVNWMPSANIKERNEDYKIDLAVPGMDKKDFHVEIENGVLTVSGERKEEINEENEKLSRREFHYGSFKRSFTLPEDVKAEDITAAYKEGILSLTVRKPEGLKKIGKKQIDVE